LPLDETGEMFEYAKKLGLDIFTTCGDIETALIIDEYAPCAWKISSGLLTHLPLINEIARLNRPVLLSTGLSNLDELNEAIETVYAAGNSNIGIFQCTSLYPAPLDTLNLNVIDQYKNLFDLPIGFSDHSIGDDAAYLAVGAGAKFIEKHFSFDPERDGFDHGISLNKEGMSKLVERVRLAEKIMGIGLKSTEMVDENRALYLRCLVALRNINQGEKFTVKNVGIKRPTSGTRGLDPKHLNSILGAQAHKDLKKDEAINIENVEL